MDQKCKAKVLRLTERQRRALLAVKEFDGKGPTRSKALWEQSEQFPSLSGFTGTLWRLMRRGFLIHSLGPRRANLWERGPLMDLLEEENLL